MVVTVNGQEIDSTDSMVIARAIAKAKREEKRKAEANSVDYRQAEMIARAEAYRYLTFALENEPILPGAFYQNGHRDSKYAFEPVACESWERKMRLHTRNGDVIMDHWGNRFTGAVCLFDGYCSLIVLTDDTTYETICYAVGVCEDQLCLAKCPRISTAMFGTEN